MHPLLTEASSHLAMNLLPLLVVLNTVVQCIDKLRCRVIAYIGLTASHTTLHHILRNKPRLKKKQNGQRLCLFMHKDLIGVAQVPLVKTWHDPLFCHKK